MRKFSSITRVNSRHISRNRRLRIAFCVGVVLIALIIVAPRLVSYVASVVMIPVVSIEHWVLHSQDTLPAYVRDRNALLAERQALERSLAEQSGAHFTVNQLQVENDILRDLLGSGTTSRIAAGVVGRPTELPYDTILIARGARHGVVKNAPVFAGRNQAIGFVGDVYNQSALVVLTSTPGVETTVYIYGPNIYTTALGVGGGHVRVHVPQGIVLEPGNLVVMPSFDAGIYGEINTIESAHQAQCRGL